MDREEKVKEEERKRGELMGEKLKRGILVGKREGNSTPSPTWKFGLIQPYGTLIQDSTNSKNILSARKLGANLWEMQPQLNLRVEKMSKQNGPIPSHPEEDHIFEAQAQSPSKQPTSRNKLKKQLEPSLTQHNLRVGKIEQAQQPLSSASSMEEMAPYQPAISPNSSLVSNRKFGESSHGLKTSTELLKVLNRIWTLEEKHVLDMSLVKTLRAELGQSQAQIQELMQEKKRDKIEIDNLTEQITELKVVRKKDKDHIKGAVKIVEEKLENEMNLRWHSEKRHHKLAKELSQVKSSLSNALRELERENKARTLLEDLCDEFAKGIRDYEQEVRFMKQKISEDQIVREENDRFVLHISEAWLDERMQMKLADAQNISESQSPLDKLCVEIEAFLREKQSGKNLGKNYCTPSKNPCESERSLDTFHLNEPASAPWNVNEEDDSVGIISSQSLKQANTSTRRQGHFGNFTSDDHVKKTAKPELTKSRTEEFFETNNLRMPGKGNTMERSSREGRNSSTTYANVDLQGTVRNSSFNFLEGCFDPSMFTGPSSPVKKWVSKVSAADPEMAESSRWAKGIKSNTLKAKLIEARLEGQQSRVRSSKSLSKGE